MFKVVIILDAFEAKMKRIEEDGERAVVDEIQNAFEVAMKAGVEDAKTNHSYKDGPDRRLTNSIGFGSTANDLGADGFLEATAEHASYVEEGTAAHDIWPKSSEGEVTPLKKGQSHRGSTDIGTTRAALRWFPDGGTTPRFAKMVHHPGNAPMPFLAPAADVVAAELVDRLELMIPRRLRRIFKGEK